MPFKKVEMTKIKLKAGEEVQGYLLSCKPWFFINDEGEKIELATAILKRVKEKDKIKVTVGGDYSALLSLGFMTKISKKAVKDKKTGDLKEVTEIFQDEQDSIE